MPPEEIRELKARMEGPKIRYTVKIVRVTDAPAVDRTWTTIGKKREEARPAPELVDEYGYVDRITRATETVTLYEQTVDTLDVRAVIAAVNAEPSC